MTRKVLNVCNLRRKGISITLSNDKQVKKLNYRWKGKNKPTNVLSFPNEESFSKNSCYLGDIILAYETLKKEANEGNILFSSHMSHLLVHGILHLKGYSHKNKSEERIMQTEEIRILKILNVNNPYKNQRLA
jgi:probable rRNA maturation factor